MMLRVAAIASRFARFSAAGSHRGSFQLRHLNHTGSELIKSPCFERKLVNKLHINHFPVPHRFPVKELSTVVVGLAAASCIANTYLYENRNIVKCDGGSEDGAVHEGGQADWDREHSQALMWMRKLWVPFLLVMTVAMGWHYPISLTINCLFLLWSTRPTPSSIYLWVEQKRLQAAQRMDGFGRLKNQLSNTLMVHVEVEDYGIACIARVSSLSQKMLVIGVLGDWWVLYSSSSSISGFSIGSWFPVSPSDHW